MQMMHCILDKILKLLTYYTPFCNQSLQSYLISKTVRFLAHPVVVIVYLNLLVIMSLQRQSAMYSFRSSYASVVTLTL